MKKSNVNFHYRKMYGSLDKKIKKCKRKDPIEQCLQAKKEIAIFYRNDIEATNLIKRLDRINFISLKLQNILLPIFISVIVAFIWFLTDERDFFNVLFSYIASFCSEYFENSLFNIFIQFPLFTLFLLLEIIVALSPFILPILFMLIIGFLYYKESSFVNSSIIDFEKSIILNKIKQKETPRLKVITKSKTKKLKVKRKRKVG